MGAIQHTAFFFVFAEGWGWLLVRLFVHVEVRNEGRY